MANYKQKSATFVNANGELNLEKLMVASNLAPADAKNYSDGSGEANKYNTALPLTSAWEMVLAQNDLSLSVTPTPDAYLNNPTGLNYNEAGQVELNNPKRRKIR